MWIRPRESEAGSQLEMNQSNTKVNQVSLNYSCPQTFKFDPHADSRVINTLRGILMSLKFSAFTEKARACITQPGFDCKLKQKQKQLK